MKAGRKKGRARRAGLREEKRVRLIGRVQWEFAPVSAPLQEGLWKLLIFSRPRFKIFGSCEVLHRVAEERHATVRC